MQRILLDIYYKNSIKINASIPFIFVHRSKFEDPILWLKIGADLQLGGNSDIFRTG